MKKLQLVAVFAFAALVGAPVFAAGGIEVKAGAGSIKAAGDKVGFDAGLGYAIRLERFFAIVPEVNFNWLSYTGAGGSLGGSGVSGASSTSANFYTLPVLLNGRFYIPMGADETPVFQPYITAGAGYGWSSFVQANPTATEKLSGFMYQAAIGFALNLGMMSEGSASATNIIVEVGYRGGQLSTANSVNADFGGIVARAGVAFSM